jgi:hypothetical protein
MKKRDYYVYGHYNHKGELRYIGKGRGARAFSFSANQRRKSWSNEFSAENPPRVGFFEQFISEEEALTLESDLINLEIKKGNKLINVIRSRGNNFADWSKEDHDRLTELRSGKNHWSYGIARPEDTRKKISETKQSNPEKSIAKYWLGKKRDPKIIEKLVKSSHTPEAIEKRRKKMTGRKLTEEHKRKIGEGSRKAPRTKEWNEAISKGKKGKPNGLKGRKFTEAHKKAISEATKGRRGLNAEEQARRLATWKKNGMTTSKAKAVICLDTGVKYRCAKDAALDTGSDAKHIQACCVGRRKTHNKLKWKYA